MLQKLTLIICLCCTAQLLQAKNILVKNKAQLDSALKAVKPGDVITLQNGEWSNSVIKITTEGSRENPITLQAETAGKVILSGNSSLELGGSFITVNGLNFTNGFTPNGAVITFRSGKKVANNCRVTNTVINNYNKPKRRSEDYWIALYGKNNRLDHNSFAYKKTFGVLLAVIMDDERSRESFHSIDHNYFGPKPPLGSNTGETIRVGVSQHCTFSSNTQIVDNVFDKCDGETEIISIKSCGNVIRNNLFRECQGAVVLRHGNGNTVEGNIFLGLKKVGTGGVRIINEDQVVANNLFYQCVGTDFRSPLVVMNGVPNSPAFRYLPVDRAIVANNTFIECSSISFGEGSDTERSQAPRNVYFFRNTFYNPADSVLFLSYDSMDSIYFSQNVFNKLVTKAPAGFTQKKMEPEKLNNFSFISYKEKTQGNTIPENLKPLLAHLSKPLPNSVGASPLAHFQGVLANEKNCGASYAHNAIQLKPLEMAPVTVACANGGELQNVFNLHSKNPLIIKLTGKTYKLEKPLKINGKATFIQTYKKPITFSSETILPAVFLVNGGARLQLQKINADLENMKADHFILMDTAGSASHLSISIDECSFSNQKATTENSSFLFAPHSSFADSIVITNCNFVNNEVNFFVNTQEKEDKGIYNAERIRIAQNKFDGQKGQLINIYRGGNDESTLGPNLTFASNLVNGCDNDKPLFELNGVQKTFINSNVFTNNNTGKTLIKYIDAVRGWHTLKGNIIKNSGAVDTNKYVTQTSNLIQ